MNQNEPCGICLEDMGERDVVSLECSHKFHLTCIVTYNNTTLPTKNCPICRTDSIIFTKESNGHLERKITHISNNYREGLLALGQIINGDLLYRDRVYICKTLLEKYTEQMYDDIEEEEDDEPITAEELVDVILTNERVVGNIQEP